MTAEKPDSGSVRRTDRTRLRRYPARASYRREDVDAILDEAIVCHLGFIVDDQPYVIPTLCVRLGDALYLHGSAASRALRSSKALPRVCVTATLIDGLVLARSAFYHSANYRSAVLLGPVEPVDDPSEKLRVLEQFTNAVVPNRWDDVRHPTRQELGATEVLRMSIVEASVKTRNGPPSDAEGDELLDAWSGVIPLELRALPPIADPTLREGITIPSEVAGFSVRVGDHPLQRVKSVG